MSESKPKTLAETAREKNAERAAKFGSTLIPSAPKIGSPPVENAAPEEQPAPVQPVADAPPQPEQTPVRSERRRPSTGSHIVLEEILNAQPAAGTDYKKLIGVTDEHHNLLRELSFHHRKPMTVILHNLLEQLKQAYEKQK